MNNIVCVKINCYKGFGFDETINGIKNAGFNYVELSTSKGNSLGLTQHSSSEELKIIKNKLDNIGLNVVALGGNSFLMDEDTSKILKNIELANYFGCHYIDTTMFNARNDGGLIASKEEIIKKIKFYLPYLEEYNLDLVIELHGSYAQGRILKDILKEIQSNNIHINYDTGNALYWGGLSVEEMLADFKDSIDYVSFMHLKDKLEDIDVWNFPALGKGYIPFEEIFKELKNKQNNSTLTVEIEFTQKGVESVEEVNKALVDSYNYLKSFEFDI